MSKLRQFTIRVKKPIFKKRFHNFIFDFFAEKINTVSEVNKKSIRQRYFSSVKQKELNSYYYSFLLSDFYANYKSILKNFYLIKKQLECRACRIKIAFQSSKICLLSNGIINFVLIKNGANFLRIKNHGFNSEEYNGRKQKNFAIEINNQNILQNAQYYSNVVLNYLQGLACRLELKFFEQNVYGQLTITNVTMEDKSFTIKLLKDVSDEFLQKNAAILSKTITLKYKEHKFNMFLNCAKIMFEFKSKLIGISAKIKMRARETKTITFGFGLDDRKFAEDILIIKNEIYENKFPHLNSVALAAFFGTKNLTYSPKKFICNPANNFLFVENLTAEEILYLKKFNLPVNFVFENFLDEQKYFAKNNLLINSDVQIAELNDVTAEILAKNVCRKNLNNFSLFKIAGDCCEINFDVRSKSYRVKKHVSYIEIIDDYFYRVFYIYFSGNVLEINRNLSKVNILIKNTAGENFICYSTQKLKSETLIENYIKFLKADQQILEKFICDFSIISLKELLQFAHSLSVFSPEFQLIFFDKNLFTKVVSSPALLNEVQKEILLFALCTQHKVGDLLALKSIANFVVFVLQNKNFVYKNLVKECIVILLRFVREKNYKIYLINLLNRLKTQSSKNNLCLLFDAVDAGIKNDIFFYVTRLNLLEKCITQIYFAKILHHLHVSENKLQFNFNLDVLNKENVFTIFASGNKYLVNINNICGNCEVVFAGRSFYNVSRLVF